MATVLAIDKDPLQLDLLSFLLQQEGHKVYATPEPDTAFDMLQSKLIDLVLVETVLQRHDGFRVCQQIRQLTPYVPLMIVSERGDEEHIVKGLEAAADDYVTKPYSPRQFLARVHALLRRSGLGRTGRLLDENLSIGEITLDLRQMHAVVNGHAVSLTKRELSLLHVLMENPARVLNRDQLTELAWGDHFMGTPKSVDVYINRIRNRLGKHLTGGSYIEAVRGFGYKFEIPKPRPVAN